MNFYQSRKMITPKQTFGKFSSKSGIHPSSVFIPNAFPVGINGGYIVFDVDGSGYYCEPRFSDGFYDCRSLGGSTGPIGPVSPCVPDRTETNCTFFGALFCTDICRFPDGTEESGNPYFCGVCTPSLSFSSPPGTTGFTTN